MCVSSVSAQKIASQIDLKVISHQCISPEYENAVCHFSVLYYAILFFGFCCWMIFHLSLSCITYKIFCVSISIPVVLLLYKMQQICIYLSSCACNASKILTYFGSVRGNIYYYYYYFMIIIIIIIVSILYKYFSE